MPFAYIKEGKFSGSFKKGAYVNVPTEPSLLEQKIPFSSVAGQSAAFSLDTTMIEFTADAICHFIISANPTAVITNSRVSAGERIYRTVVPGHKISFIAGV